MYSGRRDYQDVVPRRDGNDMISICSYSIALEKSLKENKDAIYKSVMQSDKAREINEARAKDAVFQKLKTNHIDAE